MNMAEAERAFTMLCFLCSMMAIIKNVAIIAARQAEDGNPVKYAKLHINNMDIPNRSFFNPMKSSGLNKKAIISPIMPICNPLTASMCANPDLEKDSLSVGDI